MVTRYKVISKWVEGPATMCGACRSCVAWDDREAQPPAQEQPVLAGVVDCAAVYLLYPSHPRRRVGHALKLQAALVSVWGFGNE